MASGISDELLKAYEEVFAGQRAYYDARAAEYDQWWKREGRYNLGPEWNAEIFADRAKLHTALDALPLEGEVLDIASGTGIWTEYLVLRGARVTAVDASDAMFAENRKRLAGLKLQERVEYVKADLLRWSPAKTYDAIFMAFWVSHLPGALLEPFFSVMARGLRPGGILVVLEGTGAEKGTTRMKEMAQKQGTQRLDDDIETRTLNDGRQFRIIKRDDNHESLGRALRGVGLEPRVEVVGTYLYAVGKKGSF